MRVNGRDGLTPHSAEAARSASPQTAHCAADALAVGLVRISALRRVEILLVLSRASDRVLVRDGLVLFAPEHALLIYHSLAEAAEALPDEGEVVQDVGVDACPGEVLDKHKQLAVARVVLSNLGLAKLEDGKRVAVQCPRSLVQEGIPNAEHRLNGQDTNEEGHEPGRARKRYSWLTLELGVWMGVGTGARVDEICVVDRCPHLGKVVLDEHHEDVDFCVCEGAGMRAGQVVLSDDCEKDKDFFLVLLEEQEQKTSDEVQ